VLKISAATVEYSVRRPGAFRHHLEKAVDSVSLELSAGEFVAVVGESGSGKSSLANAIFGLVPLAGGEILLRGERIDHLSRRQARRLRRGAQLVLQDPFDSLNPTMTVGEIIAEPLAIYGLGGGRGECRDLVDEVLATVGLNPAAEFRDRRPHELSGGQRQRVGVAACLAVGPDLLVADEPVSMLDVSVRAGILDVLDKQRAERGTAILMITHDLPTAAAYCDRMIVMKDGVIVEQGTVTEVIDHPKDPYTAELLRVTPKLRQRHQDEAGVSRER
jgi:peptide/nickel transport system ATP-binding protein